MATSPYISQYPILKKAFRLNYVQRSARTHKMMMMNCNAFNDITQHVNPQTK